MTKNETLLCKAALGKPGNAREKRAWPQTKEGRFETALLFGRRLQTAAPWFAATQFVIRLLVF